MKSVLRRNNMIQFCMALGGFALLMLGDYNSIVWKKKWLRPCLFFGFALLAAAAAVDLATAAYFDAVAGWDFLLLAVAAIFAMGLAYCLFFAIPFRESYVDDQGGRLTYRGGVYGLCRHSGIWCFGGMFLAMGLAALPTAMLWRGIAYTAINIAYSYFQDKIIFPKVFTDHADYCRAVPFLIPKRDSLRRFFHGGAKEE